MKIIAVVFCLMLNAGCSDNDDLTEEPPGPVHNENISIGSGNPELMLAWKKRNISRASLPSHRNGLSL